MKKSGFLVKLALSAMPLAISVASAQPVASKQKAQTITVTISGEVLAPGRYTLKSADKVTLSSLITRAGGVTKRAGVDDIMVNRGVKGVFIVDLPEVLRQGSKEDFLLLDGDEVRVPIAQIPIVQTWVGVMGAVKAPGRYPIPEGGTLSIAQALERAGGAVSDGDLADVRVLHAQRKLQFGQPFLPRPSEAVQLDQLLQNGDVIWVPQKQRPMNPPSPRRGVARFQFLKSNSASR